MEIQIEKLCKRYTSGSKTINALDLASMTVAPAHCLLLTK